MSNRRQKAMEDRCKDQHSRGPRQKDYRGMTDLKQIQKDILWNRRVGYTDAETRAHVSSWYKNGAKLFDEAIALENSPLMKALS